MTGGICIYSPDFSGGFPCWHQKNAATKKLERSFGLEAAATRRFKVPSKLGQNLCSRKWRIPNICLVSILNAFVYESCRFSFHQVKQKLAESYRYCGKRDRNICLFCSLVTLSKKSLGNIRSYYLKK